MPETHIFISNVPQECLICGAFLTALGVGRRVSDNELAMLAAFLCAQQTPLDVRGWQHASSRAAALLPEQGHSLGGGAAVAQEEDLEGEGAADREDLDDEDLDAMIC